MARRLTFSSTVMFLFRILCNSSLSCWEEVKFLAYSYFLLHAFPIAMHPSVSATGMCFETMVDRYVYRICPFQNVTMRRITASRATLLGRWSKSLVYWLFLVVIVL